VQARRIDISILNPAAMLTMAHRGTGAFTSPKEVATIAVLPHDDRWGSRWRTGSGSAGWPTSPPPRTRCGSPSAARSTRARRSWWTWCCARTGSARRYPRLGGEISYDQPMPSHPSRIGRLERGEIDAIFDEGIVMWATLLAGVGAACCRSGRST